MDWWWAIGTSPNIPVWHLEHGQQDGGKVDLFPIIEAFTPDVIHVHNVMNPRVWEHLLGPCGSTLHDTGLCPAGARDPAESPLYGADECLFVPRLSDSQDYFDRILATTKARQEGPRRFLSQWCPTTWRMKFVGQAFPWWMSSLPGPRRRRNR